MCIAAPRRRRGQAQPAAASRLVHAPAAATLRRGAPASTAKSIRWPQLQYAGVARRGSGLGRAVERARAHAAAWSLSRVVVHRRSSRGGGGVRLDGRHRLFLALEREAEEECPHHARRQNEVKLPRDRDEHKVDDLHGGPQHPVRFCSDGNVSGNGLSLPLRARDALIVSQKLSFSFSQVSAAGRPSSVFMKTW